MDSACARARCGTAPRARSANGISDPPRAVRVPRQRSSGQRVELLATWRLGTVIQSIGGEGGIRTHDALAGIPVFETGSFSHSDTHPKNQTPRREDTETPRKNVGS